MNFDKTDDVVLILDDVNENPDMPAVEPWILLIVDDEPEVHLSTKLTLDGVTILNRPIVCISAYSANEAKEIAQTQANIAIILLDVVMETHDAGLNFVDYIRQDLANEEVRIILRTGQPGYAPELDVISRYDINDYRSKNEITQTRLVASLTSALRGYQQIKTINDSKKALAYISQSTASLIQLEETDIFFSAVIEQLAGLLGIDINGFVALYLPSTQALNAENIKLVASTGQFESQHNYALSSIEQMRIVEGVIHAFSTQISHQDDNHHFILFKTRSYHFVVYAQISAHYYFDTADILTVFSEQAALCFDNLSLIASLKRSAFYDSLTQLPNRLSLINRLAHYLIDTEEEPKVLVLLDIDHFNILSETIGHEAADELLVQVAKRLNVSFNGNVFRTSGDTFAIFIENRDIQPSNIQSLLNLPFEINGVKASVSFTMGLALPDRIVGATPLTVLNGANIALKKAKSLKRGGFAWLTHELTSEVHQKVAILSELRNAMVNNEFYLVLQPQVSLKHKTVTGFEALIRWTKANGTAVDPSVFIPVAENSGLIFSLGLWVFRKACEHLVVLNAAGYPDIEVAINVSIAQLNEKAFLFSVDHIIAETGANPHRLVVEITESVAMDSIEIIPQIIADLHARGIKVALDDFGTGYSSLSYLTLINLDKIKADRSFISCLNNNARNSVLASTIAKLGHQLHLEVVAEGVETLEQLNAIQAMGYDSVQGYYFSKPIVLNDALAWLANYQFND